MKTGVARGPRVWGGSFALLAMSALVASCGSDEGESGVSTAPDGAILEQFLIAGIGADPNGGAWLLEQTDGGVAVNRFDSTEGLREVARLPTWDGLDTHVLSDGRLAAVGVRCEPVVKCDATLSEIVFVSADGRTTEPATLSTRDIGGPSESDVARVVGQTAGRVWVHDFNGQLVGLSDEGRVEQQIEPAGELCVVGDRLYQFSTDLPDASIDEPVVVLPTADPENPTTISVAVLDDSGFAAMRTETANAPSNSVGKCTADGFETYVSGDTSSMRWTPENGWAEVERALDPETVRSTHAIGSRGDEFIVDASGTLLVRGKGAVWQATPISFATTRADKFPPLVLFADGAGGSLVACLSVEQDEPERYALECREGGRS